VKVHLSVRRVEGSTSECDERGIVENVEGWHIRLGIMASPGLVTSVARKAI
jgi:hypothetical protein